MTTGAADFELSLAELREVTSYAIACSQPALPIFEQARPDDTRARSAIEAAQAFVDGGRRTKAIRDAAWSAHRAAQEARDTGQAAASEAARAALATASAAYLHPLANATQVRHILGPAAHTARALELLAEAAPDVADRDIARASSLAGPVLIEVLSRYPPAPPGRARVGELIRRLDTTLRGR